MYAWGLVASTAMWKPKDLGRLTKAEKSEGEAKTLEELAGIAEGGEEATDDPRRDVYAPGEVDEIEADWQAAMAASTVVGDPPGKM